MLHPSFIRHGHCNDILSLAGQQALTRDPAPPARWLHLSANLPASGVKAQAGPVSTETSLLCLTPRARPGPKAHHWHGHRRPETEPRRNVSAEILFLQALST